MNNDRNLILTVCTGNVCRSPMAERLLQHALNSESSPLNRLTVESSGIAAAQGVPASENSIIALRKFDLDLSNHRSQPITSELIDRTFAIFGMTQNHLDAIQYSADSLPQHLHLFRGFMDPTEEKQIPDPYGQSIDAYNECLDSMIEAIPSLLKFLRGVILK